MPEAMLSRRALLKGSLATGVLTLDPRAALAAKRYERSMRAAASQGAEQRGEKVFGIRREGHGAH